MSSRFNFDLNVDDFIVENKNFNTKRKTQADVRVLEQFICTSIDVETVKIQEISAKELDEHIAKFLVSVRKVDGTEYEPSTIKSMFNSFERYLRDCNYGFSLISSPEFHKCRQARISKCKNLKSQGKGSRPHATRALNNEELNQLYQKGVLSMKTPQALLNTVWWNNSRHFGMPAVTEHHAMKWGDVKLLTYSNLGKMTEFLQYTERQTKTRQGCDPKDARVVTTMWSTSGKYIP